MAAKRFSTWSPSAEARAYRSSLVATFRCAVLGCRMQPFKARADEGVRAMCEHRRLVHPEIEARDGRAGAR